MNCPRCNHPNVEKIADEVDIGVGIQEHLRGCVCPVCGELACYSCCGAWDFERHAAWCEETPGN